MDSSNAKTKNYKLKILITGPEGNIASSLIKDLNKKIIIYSISSKKIKKNKRIFKNHIYCGSYSRLKNFLIKSNPNIIIHLSTKWKKFDDEENKDLIDNNITFSSYLLDICSKLKTKLFLNFGSYTQLNSKGDYKPFNFYSASKESFSNILYYFYITKQIKVINLRIMNVYGIKHDNRIVNYIFQHIKDNKKNIKINDLDAYVDLIHIKDVVSGLISIINQKNLKIYKDFSYDLSSKKQLKLNELIKIIEKISKYKFHNIVSKKTFKEYLKIPYRDKRLIKWDSKISLYKGLKMNYDLFFP